MTASDCFAVDADAFGGVAAAFNCAGMCVIAVQTQQVANKTGQGHKIQCHEHCAQFKPKVFNLVRHNKSFEFSDGYF